VVGIVRYTEDKNEKKANNMYGWKYKSLEGSKRK